MARFSIPKYVFVGNDALSEAMETIKSFGEKALIVTGPHVSKSPMMQKLCRVLKDNKIEFETFDEVNSEPDDLMVEAGAGIFKKMQADFIIAIGGGSPIDTAKAIALSVRYKRPMAYFLGKEIDKQLPKIVAIPTTAGTGSEATEFAVITDTKTEVKMLLSGKSLLPSVAILDATNTLDMPRSVTAMTGLDALTHAIEAYTSKKAFALTDVYAISAVKRIMKYLLKAYENGYDEEAREQMMLAAFEAGVCINNSSVTLVHGMSRPIGALFHVPHGMSNAMLLSVCLKFAKDGAIERFARLLGECDTARATNSDDEAADMFIDKVGMLITNLGIPTLKEYGVDKEEFESKIEKMANDAIASGSPANTRKMVTAFDCIGLYKKLEV